MDKDPITATAEEDSDGEFELVLRFAAGECPECGLRDEPGDCPDCGSEIPVAEDDHVAGSRRRAFGPLAARASQLLAAFDALPDGSVPVTPDQFVAVVREAEIFPVIIEMSQLGHELGRLDLGDPKILGSAARTKVAIHLDRVEYLFGLCREVAGFDPQRPADELKQRVIASGKYGAEVVDALTRTLVASDFVEAQKSAREVEVLVSAFPHGEGIAQALERLKPWENPDPDAKFQLLFGDRAICTDADGILNPALAMMAFAGEELPYEAMSRKGRTYFRHLLGEGESNGTEAVLLAPMMLLAAVPRPLHGHRTAQLLFAALQEALKRDQPGVEALLERSTAQGPVIYAALARLQRGTKSLTEDPTDEEALERTLSAYRQLTETGFRAIGWLVVGAARINEGKPLQDEAHPPMLGELEQRLEASGRLGSLLCESVDAGLRNADAHVQYRWVPEREVVIDFRTEQEWSADDIENTIDLLISCLAGADAGYACFVVMSDLDQAAPDWLTDGSAPEALLSVASMSFSSHGYEVVEVRDRGATVVVSDPGEVDPARLLPCLAGMAGFGQAVEIFRVVTPEDTLLVEVDANTMRAALEAPPSLKGLAVIATAFESCLRTGMDPGQASRDFAALMAAVVGNGGRQQLTDRELAPGAFRDLIDQSRYVAQFAKAHFIGGETVSFSRRLTKVQIAATNAAKGNPAALGSLDAQLTALARWADDQGIHWPPRI